MALSRGLVVFVVAVLGLMFCIPGACAKFKFLVKHKGFYSAAFGRNYKIPCGTTDDRADIRLYYKVNPVKRQWTEKSPTPKKLLKAGADYTIVSFSMKDFGLYQCRATNVKGQEIQSREFFLIGYVAAIPDVKIKPRHAVALSIGESTNYTCTSAQNANLKWVRHSVSGIDAEIPSNQITTVNNKKKKSVILMIKNANLSDSGFYKCLLTFNGQNNYKLVSVKVYDSNIPTITASSGHVTARTSSKKKLFCKAQAYPDIQDFKWYKNGIEITIPYCRVSPFIPGKCKSAKYIMSIQKAVVTKSKAQLVIRGVEGADAGEYKCVAINSQGQGSATISLHVKEKRSSKKNDGPKKKRNSKKTGGSAKRSTG
ncbi:contactin-5 [Nematostella vectensis]|uniref:contactin-5 n=1 Tax=Nematostella vectensis TaxID=45351 RepID=UPI00139034E9|nr:contactin-5 [Nematostella vectensis]